MKHSGLVTRGGLPGEWTMADDTPEESEDKLLRWRVLGAMRLGYDWADACEVADTDVDLYDLRDLIERGAKPGQAFRILS